MNSRDEHINGPGFRSRDERTTVMIANKGRRAGEGCEGENVALGADEHYIRAMSRENRQEGEGRVTLNRMHRIRRTLWN